MASRRLAISSLLCSDETNPSDSSPISSPTSARTSTARDFEPVDRLSRHHPAFSTHTSGLHTQTAPNYRPLSDANYTPAVDRTRSYNDNDALRPRPTTYQPQLGYRRQPSTSPERIPTQHQHQQIYTSPMSPYNIQSPPQPSPWGGHSPLYARSTTSSSQDNHFPLTQSPVESRARSFSNSSMHLTPYTQQSTPTFSPFNPSPVSSQPPPSLGGGLEALAQAASQERRRLSNEFSESRRISPRESATRTPVVVQHPVASSSTYENSTREPSPGWRRRSKQHPEPPHKRRKSYDFLDEPIPAEPLEIFQPARPPTERSSLMRISALVPELPPASNRTYVSPKPQRSPTLPRVSDIRHSAGTGPTIPISNLLTNDPPPRRISPLPHPPPPSLPSPIVQRAPTFPPPRSPTPPRSPSPVEEPPKPLVELYRSPEAQMLPLPYQPTTGYSLSNACSPPPVAEEVTEEEIEVVHNVPTSVTPVQGSSEPPTPSPVIPVEMHPSLSPTSVQDQARTPVRLASPVAEFEPELVPTLEPPVPQLSTAVTEPEAGQAPEPAPLLVPPSTLDEEGEPEAPLNTEPPRQISIISILTPLPPSAYSSPILPIPGPGIRPPSPVPSSYPGPRHPPTQPELEPDHDPEERNDDDGTESDNMTVDMEFDLAAGLPGDSVAGGGGGIRTDSEYDMEVDFDDELLRLVNDDAAGARLRDDNNGLVGTSRYKSRAQGTNTPDSFFDRGVPPPMDLEKIMREQGQPRILYQQLQGPGQPLVPLIIHEPAPEPKPEPKHAGKGKKKQTSKVGCASVPPLTNY
ncbi:hypothetical protein BJ322DRAFT_700270 [Thelephora terrestris]|uniref:Uncharacterized protein n=1 Tax=Thelephora terrestris TaxID=56493 RepID=A0A9P6HHV1_9AGAM|nr:hypothetical protein BJ322DRAFT_700270 [Thelephora terrestris]